MDIMLRHLSYLFVVDSCFVFNWIKNTCLATDLFGEQILSHSQICFIIIVVVVLKWGFPKQLPML